MQTLNHSINPFALMCDPDAIRNALAHAAKWTLESHVCHPLDRPSRARLSREQAVFDAAVDAAADAAPEPGAAQQ